jgi:hypothetical protein
MNSSPFVSIIGKPFNSKCDDLLSCALEIDFQSLILQHQTVYLQNQQTSIPVAYSEYLFSLSQVNGIRKMDAIRGLMFSINFWPTQVYNNNPHPINGPYGQMVITNNTTGVQQVFDSGNYTEDLLGTGAIQLAASPADIISIRKWSESDSNTVQGIGSFQFVNFDVYPFYLTGSTSVWGQN